MVIQTVGQYLRGLTLVPPPWKTAQNVEVHHQACSCHVCSGNQAIRISKPPNKYPRATSSGGHPATSNVVPEANSRLQCQFTPLAGSYCLLADDTESHQSQDVSRMKGTSRIGDKPFRRVIRRVSHGGYLSTEAGWLPHSQK